MRPNYSVHHWSTYPFTHLLHLIGMGCSDSSLMVTKNGDPAVGVIVRLHLLCNVTRRLHVLQQRGHSVGSVVGTEHLCSQSLHVGRQVLVEGGGLRASISGAIQEPVEVHTVSLSKISSPSFLGAFLKIFKFLKTWVSTSTSS